MYTYAKCTYAVFFLEISVSGSKAFVHVNKRRHLVLLPLKDSNYHRKILRIRVLTIFKPYLTEL